MNKKTTSVFSIFLIIILCISLLASCGEIEKLDQSSIEEIEIWTESSKASELTEEQKAEFIKLYNAAEYDGKANGQGGTPQFGIYIDLNDGTKLSVNDFFTKLEVTVRNKKGKIKAWYYINSKELYTFMSELANEIKQTETVKTCEHTFEEIQNLNKYTGVKKCSICGMSKTVCRNMIDIKMGTVHINKPEKTPEIVCTYKTYNPLSSNSKKIKIEDTSFFEKLANVIEGKTVENKPCNCSGDYQILIGNNYTVSLHHKKSILIKSETKEKLYFTIDCSEAEMQELYDYLEKQTKKD